MTTSGMVDGAIDSTGVAKSMGCEAAAGNFAVGVKDFFAKGGKQHGCIAYLPGVDAFTG